MKLSNPSHRAKKTPLISTGIKAHVISTERDASAAGCPILSAPYRAKVGVITHSPTPNPIISTRTKTHVISTEGGAFAAAAEKPASPPRYSPRSFLAATLFAAVLLCPTPTRAQGCTQCLDTTAATPPATQRAYRHAITLMIVVAGSIFLTTLVLFKRQP